jgi:hypothetical protein
MITKSTIERRNVFIVCRCNEVRLCLQTAATSGPIVLPPDDDI